MAGRDGNEDGGRSYSGEVSTVAEVSRAESIASEPDGGSEQVRVEEQPSAHDQNSVEKGGKIGWFGFSPQTGLFPFPPIDVYVYVSFLVLNFLVWMLNV